MPYLADTIKPSDPKWQIELHNRAGLKAITGFIIYLNGSPVLWCSKKQVLTTTSTMESKLDGIALVAPHSLWVSDVCIDISSTYKANCLTLQICITADRQYPADRQLLCRSAANFRVF